MTALVRALLAVPVRFPLLVLAAALALTAAAARELPRFGFDAGSDSLVLENDPDLKIYDDSRVVFGSDEYLLIAYRRDDFFNREEIDRLAALSGRLAAIPGVSGVISLTHQAPLYRNVPGRPNLFQAAQRMANPARLTDPSCDLDRARTEFLQHEIFSNNILSPDGKITALIVNLYQKPEIGETLLKMRNLDRRIESAPEGTEREALREERAEVKATYRAMEDDRKTQRIKIVGDARAILRQYEGEWGVSFYTSGVPLITVDMIDYIRNDTFSFGFAAAGFVAVVLFLIFRRIRWVILPLSACALTVAWVLGTMAWRGTRASVLTCNLPCLLLILAMEYVIYLIVRHRETCASHPEAPRNENVRETLHGMFAPILYSALTTGAGFLSLIICDLRPVIEFGQYMSLGVGFALVAAMSLFASVLVLLPSLPLASDGAGAADSPRLAGLARRVLRLRRPILLATLAVVGVSTVGISRLGVEAQFIDYFRDDTDIHRGLSFIDREMGGTTSLEILLTGPKKDCFIEETGIDIIRDVEAHLRGIPEVGKIMSVRSFGVEFGKLLAGEDATDIKLAPLLRMAAHGSLSERLRPLVKPYVNEDWSQARIFIRMKETAPTLDRNAVIQDVKAYLAERLAKEEVRAEVTGIFVLYTNMLNSLLSSQIDSLLIVYATIGLMLIVLFRSIVLGLLALLPNILPISLVLGTMGWTGITLDMATVMIASVALGIGVDATIQYIVRFRAELAGGRPVEECVAHTHATVGQGVLYSCATVCCGFLILALSNFKPIIYFGLFTALAMFAALIGTLTVLPGLLAWWGRWRRRDG